MKYKIFSNRILNKYKWTSWNNNIGVICSLFYLYIKYFFNIMIEVKSINSIFPFPSLKKKIRLNFINYKKDNNII
jgi:hypothetical protein